MFVMTSDIQVEGINNTIKTNSFKWKRSMDNYSDTCTIIIPAICKLHDKTGTKYDNVEKTTDYIKEGKQVKISCGYDGKNNLQFQGFISRINYKVPLEIECEGYSYQFRKVLDFNKSYKSGTSMKQILDDLVSEVKTKTGCVIKLSDKIPQVTINTPVQFVHKKGTEVLDWIKTNLLQTVYFNFDELYVGLQQTDYKEKAKALIGWNTVKDDDLSFKERKDFTQVNIKVVQRTQDGKMAKQEEKDNNADDQTQTKVITLPVRVDDATMKAIAAAAQANVKYTGYEGSVTTFLEPYTQPGMALEIQDNKFKERQGTYFITGVEGEFGTNGGRVKVKIGAALDNEPKKSEKVKNDKQPAIVDVNWMDENFASQIEQLASDSSASIYIETRNIAAGEEVEISVDEELNDGTIKNHVFKGIVNDAGAVELKEIFEFEQNQ